jgi:4-hydroxy-tetrahydrodipicolinate synthase
LFAWTSKRAIAPAKHLTCVQRSAKGSHFADLDIIERSAKVFFHFQEENMFKGCLVAIITPFTNDAVDVPALRQLVNFCLDAGVDGLVPCGTTGESPVLTEKEYESVLLTVVETVAGRVPVIAGCGTNATRTTIERGKRAKSTGVDALLVVTPYYNRPGQEGLKRHFLEVAENVGLPLILYNVPSRTGADLATETVISLSAHSGIVGIKEATGSLKRASELIHALPESFSILSGDDFTTLPFVLLGGHGVISVVANVIPEPFTSMIRAARAGDLILARELNRRYYELIEALFVESNPVPVKMALHLMGIGNGEPRLPLVALSAAATKKLDLLMSRLDLIKK